MAALFIVPFIISIVLTYISIRYALSHGIMDVPNHRSSHTIPTPRGGGVSFVLATVISSLVISFFPEISQWQTAQGIIFPASLIALSGWFDDRISLSASTRLLIQLISAILFIGLVSNWTFDFHGSDFLKNWPHLLLLPILVLFLIWMTNLYNFMDGIDGIASLQCISVSLVFMALNWQNEFSSFDVSLALLMATVTGFLIFNWPPAKIFMGDVGSAFLGFFLAAIVIYADLNNIISMPTSLIILGAFITDSTYTLIVRFFRRQRIFQAHRDHAYQHATQSGHSHLTVSLFYFAINIFWLGPLAYWSHSTASLWAPLIIAYTPLVLACHYLKAGQKFEPKKST